MGQQDNLAEESIGRTGVESLMGEKTLKEIHEEVPPDFYDRSRVNFIQRLWHPRRFKWIAGLATPVSGRMLDIGCDGATLTEIVARKTGAGEVVGIDIAHQSVEYSKNKRPDFQLAVAHAEQLPFRDATFDMVFCSEVLEHVDHPEKMLGEIKRCLKEAGYAIVEVPTETWFFKAVWYVWTRVGPGKAWHHAHVVDFKGDLLDRLVKEAGFRVKNQSVFMGMLRAYVITPG